jgi:hypothetical protein
MSGENEKSLSVHLGFWRTDRPSEFKMDEFIRQAQALEEENAKLEARMKELENLVALLQAFAQKVREHVGDDVYYMMQDQVWKANGLPNIQEIQEDEGPGANDG